MKLSDIILHEARLHSKVWLDPKFGGEERPFEITKESLRLPKNWETGRNSTRPQQISSRYPLYLPDRFLRVGKSAEDNSKMSKTSMFQQIINDIKQHGSATVYAKEGRLINIGNDSVEPLPLEIAKAYGEERLANSPEVWILTRVGDTNLDKASPSRFGKPKTSQVDNSQLDPSQATFANLMAVGEGERDFQVFDLKSKNDAYEVAHAYNLLIKVIGNNYILMSQNANIDSIKQGLAHQHATRNFSKSKLRLNT